MPKRTAAKKPSPAPGYRQKKGRTQGYVTLTDSGTGRRKDYPLGEFDTPECRDRYHRLIAEWEAGGRRLPDGDFDAPRATTINDLVLAFSESEGPKLSPSKHNDFWAVMKLMRLYGDTPVNDFGPNKLRVLRERMIAPAPGLNWCRNHANRQTWRIREVIGWGVRHEMVEPVTRDRLNALEPLLEGKSAARETKDIGPVPRPAVDATLPHLNRQVAALVELQLLTGARPSELLKLKPIGIDMSGDTWVVRPPHKNAWRGAKYDRTIFFGPRAQDLISPFLAGRSVDRCLFSPREAEEERLGRKPRKDYGEHYTPASYRRAIARACDAAFPPPDRLAPQEKKNGKLETRAEHLKRLTAEEKAELKAWRKAHRWHPYQLRHAASTEIRRQFGLETAQLVLGHSSAAITDAIYAERDQAKVVAAMREIG